jgi:hypothetical protein
MMTRTIFEFPEVMRAIALIAETEEGKFSEVAGWDGSIRSHSDKAVLAYIEPKGQKPEQIWLPLSQLRKTEDGYSIYASDWILAQKGLG